MQTAKSVLRQCADIIQDGDLAKRLIAVESHIDASEKEFISLGQAGLLYQIAEKTDVVGVVFGKEMQNLYDGTFVRQSSSCRAIYDSIKVAARICPLCQQRIVSTLDHYLPQARHADLVLTPANLVPACQDCNKTKLAKKAKDASKQTLHPYFDKLPREVWVFAEVLEGDVPEILFTAEPPTTLDAHLAARARHHFECFGLAALYAAHASVELTDIAFDLQTIGAVSGAAGVRDHLLQQADTRKKASLNSWRSALYTSLSQSSWFHELGYQRIPLTEVS